MSEMAGIIPGHLTYPPANLRRHGGIERPAINRVADPAANLGKCPRNFAVHS
jgi:hypothetical protein